VGLLYQFLVRLTGLNLKILWSFGEISVFSKLSSRIVISSSIEESEVRELELEVLEISNLSAKFIYIYIL
jgi:hypothetical protein